MHVPLHSPHEPIEIGKQQALSDVFLGCLRHLENAKPYARNEIAEVIKQSLHINHASIGEIILLPVPALRWVILLLQAVNHGCECLQDAVEINRIRNLALPVCATLDDTVGGKLTDNLVIQIKYFPIIVGCNAHEHALRAWVPTNIGDEMGYVDVAFFKDLRMRRQKVRHPDCLGLRNIHFLGEYLRETVDKKRLSPCLSVEHHNHFWRERLPHFVRILAEQLLYLRKREVGQTEFVLDIKRGDRTVVVQLCDTLDTGDANAERTAEPLHHLREVNTAERVEKIRYDGRRDAIKFVNDDDNPLFGYQPCELPKEAPHSDMVCQGGVLQKARECLGQHLLPFIENRLKFLANIFGEILVKRARRDVLVIFKIEMDREIIGFRC